VGNNSIIIDKHTLLRRFVESRCRCVNGHARGFHDREETEALREFADQAVELEKLASLSLFSHISDSTDRSIETADKRDNKYYIIDSRVVKSAYFIDEILQTASRVEWHN
jgi:hypothetical protein